jgi:phenylacetate-coenzyme A ligase PaaK-like adenylate-forming protein
MTSPLAASQQEANVAAGTALPSNSEALRSLLLQSTLIHACETNEYYREAFRDIDIRQFRIDDLTLLPQLSKADLKQYYDRICQPKLFPDIIMYTSGTEGQELLVPVSAEEIASAEYLLAGSVDLYPGPRPLALTLVRLGHGIQHLTPLAPMIPTHISYGPEQVLRLLAREYDFPGVEPRISVLEGNLYTHIKLIELMRAAGVDGREFGLKLVLTTGWYVTAHKRREIEGFWGAPLLDRYGVTEVNGDSKQCPACGMFHFDPFVIAEAVDPSTGLAVERGPATLILTGLFPFNQVAPKIRYALGDLVWREPSPACGMDEPGYRFLGREKFSMFRPGDVETQYFLFPTEVADVIDDYPEVVRREQTGFLCFASNWADDDPDCIVTRIEWSGPDKTKELEQKIILRSPTLARAHETGRFRYRVELVKAGSIASISKL